MNPAEDSHALRGRSFLACPYLWITALLHASLIAVLLLSNQWTFKEWPMNSFDHDSIPYSILSALGFVSVWAVQVGILAWLADVTAYLLVQARWGLGKSLIYGAATSTILVVLVVVSLAWAAARFDDSNSVLNDSNSVLRRDVIRDVIIYCR